MTLLTRLYKKVFRNKELDIIKGDLYIYSVLIILRDKSQELFGIVRVRVS